MGIFTDNLTKQNIVTTVYLARFKKTGLSANR